LEDRWISAKSIAEQLGISRERTYQHPLAERQKRMDDSWMELDSCQTGVWNVAITSLDKHASSVLQT